jgi:hypothetical protein
LVLQLNLHSFHTDLEATAAPRRAILHDADRKINRKSWGTKTEFSHRPNLPLVNLALATIKREMDLAIPVV